MKLFIMIDRLSYEKDMAWAKTGTPSIFSEIVFEEIALNEFKKIGLRQITLSTDETCVVEDIKGKKFSPEIVKNQDTAIVIHGSKEEQKEVLPLRKKIRVILTEVVETGACPPVEKQAFVVLY